MTKAKRTGNAETGTLYEVNIKDLDKDENENQFLHIQRQSVLEAALSDRAVDCCEKMLRLCVAASETQFYRSLLILCIAFFFWGIAIAVCVYFIFPAIGYDTNQISNHTEAVNGTWILHP